MAKPGKLKKLIMIALLLMAFFVLQGETVSMKGVLKPASIAVDESRIYIGEGTSVHIFSLKDFKLEKTFGRQGEGPQEFMVHPGFGVRLALWKQTLLVESIGKTSYYSKDGGFLKELKTGKHGSLYPLGDMFVGGNMILENQTNYQTLNLYDGEFKNTKEICRWEHAIQDAKKQILLAPVYTQAHFFDDKIFVVPGQYMVIQVFDGKGQKVHVISKEYRKLEVTDQYKQTTLNFFKTDPKYRQHYEGLKNMFTFPKYFPAIRSFAVNDGRIYIRTYGGKDGKSEYYIFDIKGKLLKKVYVPFVETMGINILPLHTIAGGRLYQLVENDETEEWELHIHQML